MIKVTVFNGQLVILTDESDELPEDEQTPEEEEDKKK